MTRLLSESSTPPDRLLVWCKTRRKRSSAGARNRIARVEEGFLTPFGHFVGGGAAHDSCTHHNHVEFFAGKCHPFLFLFLSCEQRHNILEGAFSLGFTWLLMVLSRLFIYCGQRSTTGGQKGRFTWIQNYEGNIMLIIFYFFKKKSCRVNIIFEF
jgi:hypothetical protein